MKLLRFWKRKSEGYGAEDWPDLDSHKQSSKRENRKLSVKVKSKFKEKISVEMSAYGY